MDLATANIFFFALRIPSLIFFAYSKNFKPTLATSLASGAFESFMSDTINHVNDTSRL